MERVVVVIDPTQLPDYATSLIEVYHRNWGVRTVLLYPQGTSRLHIAQVQSMVDADAVAARFWIDLEDLDSVATGLRMRFDVLAVVPHFEGVVVDSGRLAELLDLDWVPMDVLIRFRDKYALKDHLRSVPGGPRMNASQRVASLTDVRQFIGDQNLSRIVVKPNDGMGNSRIAFFDAHTPDSDIVAYLQRNAGAPLVAEEYLGGREFCVNGQVDDVGVVHTLSVQRTVYGSGNGRDNLAASIRTIHHDTDEFRMAARYASQVLTCAGLVRSPFHMEIKIDEQGPCLIEVAARLGGAGIPWDTELAHDGAVCLFTQAAQYYADLPGDPPAPDWPAYDGHTVWTVFGISTHACRIRRLVGVREVEAMPEFAYWVVHPRLGQAVRPTIDVDTIPWQATICSADADLSGVESRLRSTISWNPQVGLGARLAEDIRALVAWVVRHARLLPALTSGRPGRLRANGRQKVRA